MLTYVILGWLTFALVAWGIGHSKGRSMEGAVYGVMFSWIGVIIVLCLRSKPGHGWSESVVVRPAAWLPDPSGRHQQRYWNGVAWSEHVSDAGAQTSDPVGAR